MEKGDVVLEKLRSFPLPWSVLDLYTATGISPRVLYVALAALEADGKVKSDWVPGATPRRRVYQAA